MPQRVGMVTTHRRKDWRARARTRRCPPLCARACRGSGSAHVAPTLPHICLAFGRDNACGWQARLRAVAGAGAAALTSKIPFQPTAHPPPSYPLPPAYYPFLSRNPLPHRCVPFDLPCYFSGQLYCSLLLQGLLTLAKCYFIRFKTPCALRFPLVLGFQHLPTVSRRDAMPGTSKEARS
eukprot:1724838-Pleurochrysis_carterae.AAC.3